MMKKLLGIVVLGLLWCNIGFAAELMVKDLMLAQSAALQEKVYTPLGEHASTIYQDFLENGGLGKDFSAILPFFKEKNRP